MPYLQLGGQLASLRFAARGRNALPRRTRANMCSMTAQGHPYARFRRALATGNARIAESAARDLEHVALGDALTLCLLYRDDPERYERAAARWIARLIAERPKIHLSEIELAAAGFRDALHTERGVEALRSCL